MAKKQPKGQLGDWLEEIPEEVQEVADEMETVKARLLMPVTAFTRRRQRRLFG